MEKSILNVLKYFAFFYYLPTFDEIHTFLSVKTSKTSLRDVIRRISPNIVETVHEPSLPIKRYTLGEYSSGKVKSQKLKVKSYLEKKENSAKKIHKIRFYIKLLSFFPQIKLVGLSGSVAMMNAKEKDDIDLFIITAKNRLWTGRLICLAIAQLFGLRRVHGQNKANNKVCMNLFFDEGHMAVPKYKQTEYVGHEILQMKPLFTKGRVYEEFLSANKWIKKIFPNAFKKQWICHPELVSGSASKQMLIESVARGLQLYFINRHKTSEIITENQLWFFPDDFEKKLNSVRKVDIIKNI